MSNELITQNGGVPSLEQFKSGQGAGDASLSDDLLIEKILIMQPQSRPVIKGVARMGEFRTSVGGMVVGSTDKPFDAIIFESRPIWLIFEGDGKESEWKETIDRTPINTKLPWQEVVDGVFVERQKAIDYFALIVDKETESNVPVIIRLKGTSFKTAQRIDTLWRQLKAKGSTIANRVLKFSNRQEENEKGVYYVWDFVDDRAAKPKELEAAYNWFVGLRTATKSFILDDKEDEKTGPRPIVANPIVVNKAPEPQPLDDEMPL